MDSDDSSIELLFEYEDGGVDSISNPKKRKQTNHMNETDVINLSNVENTTGSRASFHTNSELFEPSICHPTSNPPSTTWIPPLEEQHETTEVAKFQALIDNGDNEFQLNVIYDTSQHGVSSYETSNPSNENLELGSSAGSNRSFLENANSNQNFKESTHSRFEGPRSPIEDGISAQRTELLSFFTPVMEENILENTTGMLQMLYSGNEVNSVQQNQLHGQYSKGNTLHAKQLLPQHTEPLNLSNSTMFATQFGVENMINYSINNNEQVMPYLNTLPQSSTMEMEFLNERLVSNQQSPNTLFSNYQNDIYRPLAPLRSQHVSYQHNQFPLAPRGYHENMLPDLSMSLRSPILPQHHQVNQELNRANMMLNILDPMYANPMMLSRPQQLLNHQHMMTMNLPNSWHHNSECLGTLFPSVSNYQQLNQALEAPNMMDFAFQNSFLDTPSMSSRLQTMQHQGLLNQRTRPIASYPGSMTSPSSLIFDSSTLPETAGFNIDLSIPQQMENSTNNVQGNDGRQGQAWSIVELGESPTLKQFKRESNRNSLFPQVEAIHRNSSSFFPPRHMKNSLYDPIFEGIGLPIDPHLRLFDNPRR
ncbi:hypothetical protein SLEP1_g51302 [Rubroshorea leprosula]|uniref:Uncharacterized protein n=1 Tax=Rubroshorea leprosula TaxID=152421 RepID=A0AAV5M2R0_9ROSI|nr:hypothetical protein SLEP1_g51302 [Rubroshorea leprosula]